jgi:hypothetical protein
MASETNSTLLECFQYLQRGSRAPPARLIAVMKLRRQRAVQRARYVNCLPLRSLPPSFDHPAYQFCRLLPLRAILWM